MFVYHRIVDHTTVIWYSNGVWPVRLRAGAAKGSVKGVCMYVYVYIYIYIHVYTYL